MVEIKSTQNRSLDSNVPLCSGGKFNEYKQTKYREQNE